MVRIVTSEDVCLLQVQLDGDLGISKQLEGNRKLLEEHRIQMLDTILQPTEDSTVHISLVSHLGLS